MRTINKYFLILALIVCSAVDLSAQTKSQIEQNFINPTESAKPWVFWYWMHGAYSKEGITADLEAMKEVGIGGAYLMPIKDTSSKIPFQPTVRTLSPEWWALVKYTMQEAKRLGLQLAMNACDGFELAGGPWITPELSMQKLVWTKTTVSKGQSMNIILPRPEAVQGFYKDIAVYAYKANYNLADNARKPKVTTSSNEDASYLANTTASQTFRSDSACWIQYTYDTAITLRSVRVKTGGNIYQALRMQLQSSKDGKLFSPVYSFDPPRHGWQDGAEDVTFAVPPTTAKFFRLVWKKEGSLPGAEDLDAAKWKANLKVKGIYFSAEPSIHQYESKNGSMWRVSVNTTNTQVPNSSAVPAAQIVNLTSKMNAQGELNWTAPAGDWVIVRIGHTSNGHTNYTASGGLGLECDKFNAKVAKLQFDSWFAKAFEQDEALAKEVLNIFHLDSWECGSQNWGSNFAQEFKKRRGYDLLPYLLVMAGVPVESAAKSEKVLHDVRQTIAELVDDVFYATLQKEAHAKGCSMSTEAIAPTMMSDGLTHYKYADIPMGEFWLNSPTHDKPNDMRDAISGAHIYGKKIIQAESFTSVLMHWNEHPGEMKIVGDRNFALGINKMVMHVFAHNPWMDKKPGMTLGATGIYFQRDQTWFKQSKAWIEYITRCQSLLQLGNPVVDVAVFTGEELPRRSLLPDRFVQTLPGIFGKEKIAEEKLRLENKGVPHREMPAGVYSTANTADPEEWIDPLNGYNYDSFNPEVLMLMQVQNGRVVLPGGASYGVLVIPGKHLLNPNGIMSTAVQKKLLQLAAAGANIVMAKEYMQPFAKYKNVVAAPYTQNSFANWGIQKDMELLQGKNEIAWTHRKLADADVYFISNQQNAAREISMKFRAAASNATWFNPVNGDIIDGGKYTPGQPVSIRLEAGESRFVVFSKQSIAATTVASPNNGAALVQPFPASSWRIQFDTAYGGPANPQTVNSFKSWTSSENPAIQYYSGTAMYSTEFEWTAGNKQVTLLLPEVNNLATVVVNGIDCGTVWTAPYQADITKALKTGTNCISIKVVNTWHNRLIGDQLLPEEKRVTYTTAPFRLAGKALKPAGLIGDIQLQIR
ncbi:MAG TPA: glycosyl hydrolase [Phnomibacter sp.]|nr:glycosyl hydrolase [Phnomibacter sp.]